MKNIRTPLLDVCVNFAANIPENLNYITPDELNLILSDSPESVFVLDIRDKDSYEKSHIEGSINIFLREIFTKDNIKKIPLNKLIVVCCWVGHTASQILTLLQLLGYNAIGLKYGMGVSAKIGEIQKGWLELGYTVSSSNQH